MPNRKSILAAMLVVAALGPRSAVAQSGTDGAGPNGNYCIQTTTATDVAPPGGSSGFDLLTRFRVGMFPNFSWGRGAVGRPGLLRSSTAVLRERRGLTLR